MNLVELSGRANNLSIVDIDPAELNPMDRGVYLLSMVAKIFPGITWGQMYEVAYSNDERLMGWWTDTKKFIGRQTNNVKDGLKDGLDVLGEYAGDFVRLISDDEVIQAIQSYGQAYATNGASFALEDITGKFFGTNPNTGTTNPTDRAKMQDILAAFGGGNSDEGIPKEYIYLGLGGLALVTVLLIKK